MDDLRAAFQQIRRAERAATGRARRPPRDAEANRERLDPDKERRMLDLWAQRSQALSGS
jgi:hypothetical protein